MLSRRFDDNPPPRDGDITSALIGLFTYHHPSISPPPPPPKYDSVGSYLIDILKPYVVVYLVKGGWVGGGLFGNVGRGCAYV